MEGPLRSGGRKKRKPKTQKQKLKDESNECPTTELVNEDEVDDPPPTPKTIKKKKQDGNKNVEKENDHSPSQNSKSRVRKTF